MFLVITAKIVNEGDVTIRKNIILNKMYSLRGKIKYVVDVVEKKIAIYN